MARQNGKMTGLKRVVEVSHGLVDREELPVVDTIFLLRRAELPGKGGEVCQAPCARCWQTAPMAVVEASLTETIGAVESGCARRAARDRLASHSSKAVMNAAVQVTGWEPLTLGPERTS